MLIQGGRILDPASGRDEVADLRIEAGCVAEIGALTPRDGESVVSATGLIVTPGLIDLCVHLREPGFEAVETIRTGAEAALAGGFTAIAAMPDTDPPVDTEATVAFCRLKGEEAGAARVHPVGALTQGRRGEQLSEMGGMARAGAVAFSDEDLAVARSEVFLRALRYAGMHGRPVLTRCEDPGLRGSGVVSGGLIADLLALPAVAPGTEEIMLGRNLYFARQLGAPLHLLHLSTAESIRQVRAAKQDGVSITCSVTPHHLLFTEESIRSYESVYKYRPPLRPEADREALVAALIDGTIDAVSSDHSPVGEEEKNVEFIFATPGTGGLETTFAVLHTRLVEQGDLPLLRLIELLSTAPAQILGVPGGSLEVGAPADISCFDLQREWRVEPRYFRSRSHVTPFAQWEVRGRACHVWVGGDLRWHDYKAVR
ncbi:MAG: dihydroorotase [Planctomycetota bacterium]